MENYGQFPTVYLAFRFLEPYVSMKWGVNLSSGSPLTLRTPSNSLLPFMPSGFMGLTGRAKVRCFHCAFAASSSASAESWTLGLLGCSFGHDCALSLSATAVSVFGEWDLVHCTTSWSGVIADFQGYLGLLGFLMASSVSSSSLVPHHNLAHYHGCFSACSSLGISLRRLHIVPRIVLT